MARNGNTEPQWVKPSMRFIELMLFTNTYALLILGIIIINFPRSSGLDWAGVAMLSFLSSILAAVIAIAVRLCLLSEKGKRKKLLLSVMFYSLVVNLLGFTVGIIVFAVFIFTNVSIL